MGGMRRTQLYPSAFSRVQTAKLNLLAAQQWRYPKSRNTRDVGHLQGVKAFERKGREERPQSSQRTAGGPRISLSPCFRYHGGLIRTLGLPWLISFCV